MKDNPKGLNYVIGLFGILSVLLCSLIAWHTFGNPSAFMPDIGDIDLRWIGVTFFVAAILFLAAWSLHSTNSPWAWGLALLLNVLLLGSVLILPLLIISILILLKNNTRKHFGVNFNKRAPTIA